MEDLKINVTQIHRHEQILNKEVRLIEPIVLNCGLYLCDSATIQKKTKFLG